MSKIHQIQFQFLPVEDRLLLKINTTEKEEFSFLLTRRFVSLLYPILTKILHADSSIDEHKNNLVRDEMLKLQQQDSVEKSDNKSPYQTKDLIHPIGNQPILLSNISTNENAGELKLSLTPEEGQGVSFSVDQNLTHLLRNLLLEALEITEWDLKFQTDYISPTSTQPDKKLLH